MRLEKKLSYYTFLLVPVITVIIFITVVIIPFILGISYSFISWDGIPANPKTFVGIANYKRLLGDSRFISAGWHTLVFTFFSLLLTNSMGLIMAMLVTTKLKTKNAARTMFFVPYLIGGLLLGFIWKFIFASPMESIGSSLGLENILFNWLISKGYSMAALVIVNAWKMAGYIMIIFITGFQSIPTELEEAASVDGADARQRFFKIKIPLLAPSITITTFMTLSNSFKIFDVNLSLTGGGPVNTTEMFAMNIYNEIFKSSNFGYGQAKAIIFFIFVAIITLLQTYFNKKREVVM